jgi:hypothetical protein
VHADGEIWAETLWDIRTALGPAVGESLITEGLRLSPPEPSFLDARNAITRRRRATRSTRRRWAGLRHARHGLLAQCRRRRRRRSRTPRLARPAAPKAIAGRVTSADTGPAAAGRLGRRRHTGGRAARSARDADGGDGGGRPLPIAGPAGTYPRLLFTGRARTASIAVTVRRRADAVRDAVLAQLGGEGRRRRDPASRATYRAAAWTRRSTGTSRRAGRAGLDAAVSPTTRSSCNCRRRSTWRSALDPGRRASTTEVCGGRRPVQTSADGVVWSDALDHVLPTPIATG